MSYATAMKSFKENCEHLDPEEDPIKWNLNNGLYQLATQMNSDSHNVDLELRSMKYTLDQIRNQIKH